MTRNEVLDLYFIQARFQLVEVAAFLDRVERSEGAADFRLKAMEEAVASLSQTGGSRAKKVLLALSDPTQEPIPSATTKAACGAWPGAR